jgi:predicted O-methyltransferase YrrM
LEGSVLANLSAGKRVMEIGSYCGRSTICIARLAQSVLAVDYFDGRSTPQPGDTRAEFLSNLARYGVSDKVSTAHPEAKIDGPFDLVFIDGNHDREFVEADISKALAAISPNALLVFHDYETSHAGVTEAVNQLLANGGELVSRHDSLAVVRPPAAMLLLHSR